MWYLRLQSSRCPGGRKQRSWRLSQENASDCYRCFWMNERCSLFSPLDGWMVAESSNDILSSWFLISSSQIHSCNLHKLWRHSSSRSSPGSSYCGLASTASVWRCAEAVQAGDGARDSRSWRSHITSPMQNRRERPAVNEGSLNIHWLVVRMIQGSFLNHTECGGSCPVNSGRRRTPCRIGFSMILTPSGEQKALQLLHY